MNHTDKQSIVIPIMAGLGNAILTVPMVRQLKHSYPNAHVTILARTSGAAEIYSRLEEVDEVILMGRVRHVLSALRRVRNDRPKVAIVPFPSNRWQYMAILLLTGAKRRILHRYRFGCIRTLGFIPAERIDAISGIHDIEQNLRLLGQLGIKPDLTEPPRFVLNEEDHLRAQKILSQAGLSETTQFITIHPGSGKTAYGQAKRWPPKRWAQLINLINEKWHISVVIMEGPDERGLGSEISTWTPSATVFIVKPKHISDTAAILARSMFFVGSDSALGHLAASVEKKAITIFGPADSDRICPYGCRDLVIQPENIPCAPCLKYPVHATSPKLDCKKPRCMEAVKVQDVLAKIGQLL